MYDNSIQRYRNWYAHLLRFHPRTHYERFHEGMEQTFSDLLRERAEQKRGLFVIALWMFVETSVGIITENIHTMRTKRTPYFVVGMMALLLVPFFAMQFNVAGWDWDATDFVIMAILLGGAGFALAAATNSEFSLKKRLIGLGAVGFLCILYVHLAVGIVDSWPLAGS